MIILLFILIFLITSTTIFKNYSINDNKKKEEKIKVSISVDDLF